MTIHIKLKDSKGIYLRFLKVFFFYFKSQRRKLDQVKTINSSNTGSKKLRDAFHLACVGFLHYF